jgi:hypothetical protein
MDLIFSILRFFSYSMIFHLLISTFGPIIFGGITTFCFWLFNGFRNQTNYRILGYAYLVEFFLECFAYSICLIWLITNMVIEPGINAIAIKICSIFAFFSVVNMPEENFRTQKINAGLNDANNFFMAHRNERLIIGAIVILKQMIFVFSSLFIHFNLGVIKFFTQGNAEFSGWLILHFFSALTLVQFSFRSFFKRPNF